VINGVIREFECVITADAEDVCLVLDDILLSFSRCILQLVEQFVGKRPTTACPM